MTKRTRIVNDPADLVPLLQTFGSDLHKEVFDLVSQEWKTKDELTKIFGRDIERGLQILKKGGLIESKWRMPESGKSIPIEEFHSSYSIVRTNFQCTMSELSDIIMITFIDDNEFQDIVNRMVEEVDKGNLSLSNLSRVLDLSPTYIKGIAKRSLELTVKGSRIERTHL